MSKTCRCRQFKKGPILPPVATLTPVEKEDGRTSGLYCLDCLMNQLQWWPTRWTVEALPGSEDEVARTVEAAAQWLNGEAIN
jgi:hypothetical protein